MKAFTKTTVLSLLILLVLYCGAGTYGYLSYGEDVAADIMLMYDAHDPLVVGGILALIIKMVTTYPPVVFCGRDTIIRLLMSRKKKKNNAKSLTPANGRSLEESKQGSVEQSRRYQFFHLSITSVWNVAVLLLSLIIPNITIAIGFLGSLASANVFIFPGLALIGLSRQFRAIRMKSESDILNDENAHHSGESSKLKNLFGSIRLENLYVQLFLTCYGAFIVAMGVLMCVIILWQMTRDLGNPTLSHELCKTSIAFL